MQNNVLKRSLVVGIILFFIGASIVSAYNVTNVVKPKSIISYSRGNTLYVGGSGAGNYSTIQSAIDNASSGDTVFVYDGTYNNAPIMPYCAYVFINKNINLMGENEYTTIINCPDAGIVGGQTGILVGHDSIVISNSIISGFTLSGGDDEGSIGIYSHRNSNNITIENCIIHNFADGIEVVDGSRDIVIHNCITYNNSRRGGFSFAWSDVSDFEISGCTSFSNTYGINIAVATNGLIYHNNLYDNDVNAYDGSANIWYNTTLQEGNYYDDYTDTDADGDGIGDTPYNIPGGSNQDLYPLMNPWGEEEYDVYVDDDADPGWYDSTHVHTIQEGIDNATTDDTVYVYNGTYYENVIVNKTINLIGEDKNNTIIDGNSNGIVVNIISDLVNISGFTFQNSGNADYNSGIFLSSNHNIIKDCIFQYNYDGIYPYSSNYNTINDNIFCFNSRRGINTDYSSNNSIFNNVITNNTGRGMLIDAWSYNSSVYDNYISYNNIGIGLDDSSEFNMFFNNVISNNVQYGIDNGDNSNNNLFYHNNLIDNGNNARDECTNTWFNSTIQEGNYWSDFDEPSEGAWDNNSDGIVDSPYPISGGSNQDNYPLMYPYNSPTPDFNMTLLTGWNLLGWYHDYDTTASSLSENITGCNSVSMWNTTMQTYNTYIVGGPPTFDFVIKKGMGLFVDVSVPSIWHGEG